MTDAIQPATPSPDPSGVAAGYAKPATRGELRDLLASGVAYEVASHVAEMTAHMLRGWLGLDTFTMRPSENTGWTVFEA